MTKTREVIQHVISVNLKHVPLFLQSNLIEKQWYFFNIIKFLLYHTFCDLSKSLLNVMQNFFNNFLLLFTNEIALIRSAAIQSTADFLKLHPRFFSLVFKKSFELYCACYKQTIYQNDEIIKSLTANVLTLVSVNSVMAYQFIFENLRTNARTLRDALSLKNKKISKDFYNWKMLGTFDLWFTVISKTRDIPNITDLIFPLVEITLTILRLSDSPAFYPSQLHYIRSILKIVTKDLYIPLIPNILKILLSNELTTLGTKSDEKSPIIRYMNHIPTSLYHSKLIKDALFDEASDVFLEYLCIVSQSITFPEFSFFVTRWLRKANKSIKVVSISKKIKILTDKVVFSIFYGQIEETAENITKIRDLVDFSPKDSDKIVNSYIYNAK
ncbi:LOW QUALITY PROTEIN: hypothetical protein MXB_1078 [Myxobolus squamalis]|nr:LOW QUALITY PROTEIN: hypothetical protein MXB_1078 [Myxobolus squamalis]